MLLLLISFVGGVLTILAPCILPLIPIIVGGSLADGTVDKKKAVTVVASLGVSVIVFTFLLKVSTLFINIPAYTWTLISGGIILFFGIVTLFPSLWENQFLAHMSAKSNILLGKGDQKKSFWGDVIVGAALGPVFSTCSPTYFIVLATVLPVNPALGLVYLLSYALGLCLSLLLVTLIGQRIITRLGVAADPHSTFKRVLGVLFIIVGVIVITGFDKKIQLYLLEAGVFDVTSIEQKLLTLATPTISHDTASGSLTLDEKKKLLTLAPEISTPDGFVNTRGMPITLAEFRGKKVVLLDIWTYSCINCQRTIPYLKTWYDKYKDQGLEIIGLHTPEFAFEKVQQNVEDAVKKFGITYPVVLDNDYSTWNALGNQYWPRKYLIDEDGYIVYDHIGEGGYEETERQIQKALKEFNARMNTNKQVTTDTAKPSDVISFDGSKIGSPETYFGSNRNNSLANGNTTNTDVQNLKVPTEIQKNALYLGGSWAISAEYAENKSAGSIVFKYEAKNVYFVASSVEPVDVEILKDGKSVKKITIHAEQLYTLIEDSDYGTHTLEIKIPDVGLKAFTFTFG